MDGRLHSITDEERGDHRVLLGTLTDSTGSLTLEFHDAHPDLAAGPLLRLTGHAHRRDRSLVISDPDYRIIGTPGEECGPSAGNNAT